MKAILQLHHPVNVPATRGAKTNPMLPKSPLTPRAVPVLEVLETNQEIPTGWYIEANNPIPASPQASIKGVWENPVKIVKAPVP